MQNLEKGALVLRKAIEQIQARLASPAFIADLRDQEFWFDNLVENGTFDSGAAWGYGSGWTIGSGVASSSSATGNLSNSGSQRVLPNDYVQVGFSISNYSAGSIRPILAGGIADNGTFISSNGTHGETLLNTGGNTYLRFQPSGFVGDLDNAFAYLSDGTNIIHRMPTGWKPRRVYVDGILQREGATHDYEVKQDPEGYYIVPAVAPGANTETCILGVRA